MMKRSVQLGVMLNAMEMAALLALCARFGRTKSEMVREILRAEATRQGVWPTKEEAEAMENAA